MEEGSSEDNLMRFAVVYNHDFQAAPPQDSTPPPSFLEASQDVVKTAAEVRAVLATHGLETFLIPVDSTLDCTLSLLLERKVDAVFNLVESLGNDSSREPELPALLEAAAIPYTGNGPAALRLAYRKDQARHLLAAHSLPVARCLTVWRPEEATDGKLARLGLPVFVKPAHADASIGIDQGSVFFSRRRLRKRISWLLGQVSGPVLVEEYLPGPEFNVAIFPNPYNGRLSLTEIDFSRCPGGLPPVVTYSSKWLPEAPDYAAFSRLCSDLVPKSLQNEILHIARAAFLTLGSTSYGRVDLRLDARGRPMVIDVNPNPDLAPDAGLAVAARAVGVSYEQLVLSIATGASLKESHASTPPLALRPRTFGCATAAY
jgi:D-alanine-D-alanine ligase